MLKHWQNKGILFQGFKRHSEKLALQDEINISQKSLRHALIGLLPTFLAIIVTLIIDYFTASGYSVIILVLLTAMLYSCVKYGLFVGFLSAIVLVLYNFYVVSELRNIDYFSVENARNGIVVALTFLLLAFVVGRMKERIDALLRKEKNARLKAEESARQLQFMATSMPQKIFTILPNGESDYVNPQWDIYTGDNSGSSGEADWSKIVHPNDYDENAKQWKHSLETGEPFQFEHRLRRNDGQYRWHLTRATAMRDKKGTITMWVGSSTDIEDIRKNKKLEADTARLTRQRAQLMELNNAKDEFISLASHQLRTPATGVKQYLNMAIDGFAGPVSTEVSSILKKANDSNERQLKIINDLLQVAQVDAGKVILRKESINVGELIANVIHEQASKFAKHKQKVVFEKPKKTMSVYADITKLRMVLENIIDNAGKYSPPGTTITVKANIARGNVNISVIDKGVGMPKKDIDKVFEKFVRLDNPLSKIVGGSGLGLYWGQKIIDLHGGKITVSSELDKGTTFTISLPT